MSKKWASYTFSLFLKHEMSYTSQGRREKSPKPLAPMDGRGIKDLHKCGEEMSKDSSLPSREQQETSELNGSGGGRGKGIRGPRPFVPVGDTNRDKRVRGHFVPVGSTNRDKRGLVSPTGTKSLGPLIPFPLPPPEPFSSLIFLLFLARDRGVLAHFFTTFVKIFDSPSIHRR